MLALMAGCSTLSSLNPFSSKVKANPPAYAELARRHKVGVAPIDEGAR